MRILRASITGWPLVAAVLAVGCPAAFAQPVMDRPASILVFPRVLVDDGHDAVIQIANTGNSVTRARCLYVGADGASIDFTIDLTRQQPTFWTASTGRSDSGGPPGPSSPVPPVPTPFQGELVCLQVDTSGLPSGDNALVGQATIADRTTGDVAKYLAVGLTGTGNNNLDGVLCIGGDPSATCPMGAEYNPCPQRWSVDHVTEGATAGAGTTTIADLTIVPCTQDLFHQTCSSTRVGLLSFTEFGQKFSTSRVIQGCWGTVRSPFDRATTGTDYVRDEVLALQPAGAGILVVAGQVEEFQGVTASEIANPHAVGVAPGQDVLTLP